MHQNRQDISHNYSFSSLSNDTEDDGLPALWAACLWKLGLETILLLQGRYSYTALHVAAADNQVDAVKLLLQHGANIDAMVRTCSYVQGIHFIVYRPKF